MGSLMKALKKLPPISDRQAEILLYIQTQIRSDVLDRSPTLRRIGIKFGFCKSNAFRIIECLRDFKCLQGGIGLPGGLVLTEQGERVCERLRGDQRRSA